MKKILILSVLFLVLLSNLFCKDLKLQKSNLTFINNNGNEITVLAEMAVTPEQRERGFMFRKKIPQGTGMLFVFENDQLLHFWMKNTPTPLSIAYITSDGTIKDIFDMTPYSTADVSSTAYVRYALEVPKGWFSSVGIKKGCTLKIDF